MTKSAERWFRPGNLMLLAYVAKAAVCQHRDEKDQETSEELLREMNGLEDNAPAGLVFALLLAEWQVGESLQLHREAVP